MTTKLILITLIALYFTGCTKAKPYKEVGKPDLGVKQEAKAIIDLSADYLYVPSSVESARTAGSSRPHWEGDAKRVRFAFTEKALRVVEPEADGRFSANPVNNRAVLQIPVEYVDYRCAEDDFGKCTHKEEENKDITWDKKRYFVLKPDELALQQVSFLPVELEKFFSPCIDEVGSEFIKSEIDGDSVNLTLEKTYRSKGCGDSSSIESLGDLTFSVRYQHSFVKLAKVATPEYKALTYTRADEGNFGFFNTAQHLLDVDNGDTVGSLTHQFDRWAPNKKVVYYLSEGFNKTENTSLKKAAYDAIAAINAGLTKSGAALRIELRDPVVGMSSGDIRNNMIVLEEDPQAAGVIGYGPHASNPLTGEILHAKTIMYLGTMKKYLKYNYDEFVQDRLEKANKAVVPTLAATPAPTSPAATLSLRLPAGLATARLPSNISAPLNIAKLKSLASGVSTEQAVAKDLRAKLEFQSRFCNYPAEMFNFENAVQSGIDEVLKSVDMKPWIELTDAEKQKVIDVLLPYVFEPTLVHELGHNLGLRHNFAGSEDKTNFYSDAELKALGVSNDVKYSSVMDYAFRQTNELHTLGKYDIAALRYAYKEEVELSDGRVVTLGELRKNPALEIKPYGYCTDEHVGANPNCNRFDEGTNLLEIANFWKANYNQRYQRSNFRNGRRRFSLMQDSAQIGALDDMFNKQRLLFERYEKIKRDFDLASDAPEWESIPFLKELKAAVLVSGQFFLDVIKTPDLHCAIAAAADPSKVLGVLPIRELSKRAITCFDKDNVALNPQYVVVGEAGRSFVSRKSTQNENAFADEVDVRGIYIDKILATHYLFTRELGSSLFDEYTENYLDMPEMQQPILQTLDSILSDLFTGTIEFRLIDGSKTKLNIGYRLFDIDDAKNSHKLPTVMSGAAREMLGLPSTTTTFHQQFLQAFMNEMPSPSVASPVADALLPQLRVLKEIPHNGLEAEYVGLRIAGSSYFAHKDSGVALGLLSNFQTTSLLGGLTAEQLAKVQAAVDDTGLSDAEKAARALGPEVLASFANGELQAPGYYSLLIQSLAR